jgi:hypothetical protein
MARDIENALNKLAKLLLQLERHPVADSEIKELAGKAQQEITNITQITSNALALQRQHDTWKKK